MNDIVKRLRIKASVISMGEKIAWGSDTDLMNEAADIIEALETELIEERKKYESQIQRMKNCQNCTHEKGEWYKGAYVFGEICTECLDSNNLCNWQLKQSENSI